MEEELKDYVAPAGSVRQRANKLKGRNEALNFWTDKMLFNQPELNHFCYEGKVYDGCPYGLNTYAAYIHKGEEKYMSLRCKVIRDMTEDENKEYKALLKEIKEPEPEPEKKPEPKPKKVVKKKTVKKTESTSE